MKSIQSYLIAEDGRRVPTTQDVRGCVNLRVLSGTPRFSHRWHEVLVPVAFSLITALGPAYSYLMHRGSVARHSLRCRTSLPARRIGPGMTRRAIPETRSQHLALAGYFGQAGVAAAFRRWVQAVLRPTRFKRCRCDELSRRLAVLYPSNT